MAPEPYVPQGWSITYSRCRVQSYEYRSTRSWRGIPVVHVAFGRWDGRRYQPARARGLIAVGDTAVGMVAVGIVAVGGVAACPVALRLSVAVLFSVVFWCVGV